VRCMRERLIEDDLGGKKVRVLGLKQGPARATTLLSGVNVLCSLIEIAYVSIMLKSVRLTPFPCIQSY